MSITNNIMITCSLFGSIYLLRKSLNNLQDIMNKNNHLSEDSLQTIDSKNRLIIAANSFIIIFSGFTVFYFVCNANK